jgi:hypothetical protein
MLPEEIELRTEINEEANENLQNNCTCDAAHLEIYICFVETDLTNSHHKWKTPNKYKLLRKAAIIQIPQVKALRYRNELLHMWERKAKTVIKEHI